MRILGSNSWRIGVPWIALFAAQVVVGIDLDISQTESIKDAARTAAYGMMTYYHGNESGQIVGDLPAPYYWWEAGAMFMSLIQYWYLTGDTTYNNITMQGLLAQIGPDKNYMPPNQTKQEGNDDQSFWAFAALTAAELKFPNPPEDQPSWLALAQAVFNFQTSEWENDGTCGGGLRWQIFTFNNGYDLKNTISNGGFLQLAARLAVYTGNQTYADWAIKMWDWMEHSPLLDTQTWTINDNTDVENNCTTVDRLQWSYNYGTVLMGSAYMYNFTNGSSIWQERVTGVLDKTFSVFFPAEYGGNIMSEVACEVNELCNYDQPSFKAYLSSWMAFTTQMVPWTYDLIMPKLQASAIGAAKQCSGAPLSGATCGRRWYQANWDGEQGVGEEMSAMSVFGANLIPLVKAPVTAMTGGTSKSNPSAGTSSVAQPVPGDLTHVSTQDRAGAIILTVLVCSLILGGTWWIIV